MITDERKRTMVQYLMGKMSDGERASFEDQYLADTTLFHELVEVENDLIDLYAQGALPETERAELHRSLLARAEGRQRIAFARALAGYADESESTTPLPSVSKTWSTPLATQIATVGVAVATVAIFLLLIVNHRMKTQLDGLSNKQADQIRTIQTLQQQIDTLTNRLEKGLLQQPEAIEPSPNQRMVSFNLSAGFSRGSSEAKMFFVPRGTDWVSLRFIAPGGQVTRYSVFLETADGHRVWTLTNAKSQPSAAENRKLSIKLPARLLIDGDYVVRVVNSADAAEDLAGYSFRVVRK